MDGRHDLGEDIARRPGSDAPGRTAARGVDADDLRRDWLWVEPGDIERRLRGDVLHQMSA